MSWIKFEGSAVWVVVALAFLILGMWESSRPRRALALAADGRWGRNGLLLLVSGILQTAVFRLGPLAAAAMVADSPWGLLNRPFLPFAVQFAAAILLLDLVHYLTHRLFHAVGFLWRIHEIHHSDADYDVSTAARFHPLEVIVAKGFHLAAIAILAPPLSAVFFAELHTGLVNVFAHANVALPPRCEAALRWAIITPDLHRVHHSEETADQNRNFGQTFVWWDRLWGTYLPQSISGNLAVATGVRGAPSGTSVLSLITRPFKRR